jgi:hypothetical protein
LFVTFVLLSCSTEPATQSPPASPPQSANGTATAPASTASAAPQREITIDDVEIANPVVVSGVARTFENNVALRVRDANGRLITESFTTSDGEAGRHNPYRGAIWLPRDPGGRITVEALEYSAKDGSERSLVSVTKSYEVERVDVKLYVPDANCNGVHPEMRVVPKSVGIARLLVEMLIAEPAPFPKGSRVQSVNLRDGVLTVDFNERLQNVGGSCAAQMIRAATTETLRQLPSVRKVVITAGGSEKLALQP